MLWLLGSNNVPQGVWTSIKLWAMAPGRCNYEGNHRVCYSSCEPGGWWARAAPSTPAWPGQTFPQPHGDASATAPHHGLGPTTVPRLPQCKWPRVETLGCCWNEKPLPWAPPAKPLRDHPRRAASSLRHSQPLIELHTTCYPCLEAVFLILWLLSPDSFFWESINIIKRDFFNNFQSLHICKQNSRQAAWKYCGNHVAMTRVCPVSVMVFFNPDRFIPHGGWKGVLGHLRAPSPPCMGQGSGVRAARSLSCWARARWGEKCIKKHPWKAG